MAPVITNGINGTGGANSKGNQSPKMHSKVVGVTLFSFSLYERVFLEYIISRFLWMSGTSGRHLSGMLTAGEEAVVYTGSRHTAT